MRRNPFSFGPKRPIQALSEASVARHNEAINLAKRCFNHEDFQAYRRECEQAMIELFEEWLDLPVDDNYALKSIVISERIRSLRALGISVISVASMEPREVKKQEPVKSNGV